MVAWILLAQLASTVIDLSGLKSPVIAMRAVELDGDAATEEWLATEEDGSYRAGRIDPPCHTDVFHPDGTAPTFAPRRDVPIQRVGTRDKFVWLDVPSQTLHIYDIPGCQP